MQCKEKARCIPKLLFTSLLGTASPHLPIESWGKFAIDPPRPCLLDMRSTAASKFIRRMRSLSPKNDVSISIVEPRDSKPRSCRKE